MTPGEGIQTVKSPFHLSFGDYGWGLEDLPSSVVLLTALGRSHEPLWSPVRLVWTLLDPPEPEVHRLAWRREKEMKKRR